MDLVLDLFFVKFLSAPCLDLPELPDWCSASKELVDFFQRPALELGNEEECENDHDNVDSSINVPDLSTEVGVLLVDQIRDSKGCDKGCQDRDDASQEIGLLLDSERRGLRDDNIRAV